jgi:hypothetical protein
MTEQINRMRDDLDAKTDAWLYDQQETYKAAERVLRALYKGELPQPPGLDPTVWMEARKFAWAILIELDGCHLALDLAEKTYPGLRDACRSGGKQA